MNGDTTTTAQQEVVEAALKTEREAMLRDMFATAALGAIIVQVGMSPYTASKIGQAMHAYEYADAMIKARTA